MNKTVKAVILVGGVSKGTRFRPLSLDVPKPLFPIAGKPIIHHHIEHLTKQFGSNLTEILLVGFFEENTLATFVKKTSNQYNVPVKYLKEPQQLGTAGGLAHFKSQILQGSPDFVVLLHGDICSSFPLKELVNFHVERAPKALISVCATRVKDEESHHFGCLVDAGDEHKNRVLHYAEKPENFVSNLINCGVYCLSPQVLEQFDQIKERKQVNTKILDIYDHMDGVVKLETDILAVLAGEESLYVYELCSGQGDFWQQIKNAGSVINAQDLYMNDFKAKYPERLAARQQFKCEIIGNVVIDETAEIEPTAKIGPNVAIGAGAKIGAGVRISNAIILDGVEIKDHSLVSHSIIGWNSTIGMWTRVEGTHPAHSHNVEPNAHDNKITIFGAGVKAASEIIVRNCVVLPHKELGKSISNKILL